MNKHIAHLLIYLFTFVLSKAKVNGPSAQELSAFSWVIYDVTILMSEN